MVALMAMLYFNPSRHIMTVTAVFPLFVTSLYLYARFSSDPGRTTSALKPVLAIIGTVIAILIVFNLFLTPVWNSEVIVPVQHFYPQAQVDLSPQIKDGHGQALLDVRGVPLIKNKMMTAPDGRQYKVEGKLLINLEYKKKLVYGFEIWNVFWLLMMFMHCWYWRGRNGLLKFFVAALVYGFLLESSGVAGDFFREYDYSYYLPMLAAPIATMAGWAVVFYSAIFNYEMIERRWPQLKSVNGVVIGLMISLIALFGDLNIDPVATGIGFWTWHELLSAWYLGVPLLNFVSWLAAVFVFGVGYTYIHRTKWAESTKIIAMIVLIPVFVIVSGIINFGIMGVAEGFNGPSWQVRSLNK